jgi:hypothetical protein
MCESQTLAPSPRRALWNIQTDGVRGHKLQSKGSVLPDAAGVSLPAFAWRCAVWEVLENKVN